MNPAEVFYNLKSSKTELRNALGVALGLPFYEAKETKPLSLHGQIKEVFLEEFFKITGLHYQFSAKDGKAVKELTTKLASLEASMTDTKVVATFKVFLEKMPAWQKENCFTLPSLNSQFNNIILQIKKKQNGSISDYKTRIINELFA